MPSWSAEASSADVCRRREQRAGDVVSPRRRRHAAGRRRSSRVGMRWTSARLTGSGCSRCSSTSPASWTLAGNVPQIGDADDGLLVRFDPARDFDPFHSLLATRRGAVRSGRVQGESRRSRRQDRAGCWDDTADLRFASLALDAAQISRCPCVASSRRAVITSSVSDFETPEEVRIVADAGPLGYPVDRRSRACGRACSFTLSAGGAADPRSTRARSRITRNVAGAITSAARRRTTRSVSIVRINPSRPETSCGCSTRRRVSSRSR